MLAMAAWAGEVQVQATRPVVVAIDGQPTGIAGTLIDTKDVAPGRHRIEVRSFMGATLGTVVVQLDAHERVQLLWDRDTRTLLEVQRVPLTSSTEPPQPASDLPPIAGVTRVERPATGSLTVTGLSDLTGTVHVQGVAVAYDSDTQGFLATGLAPPAVELHVTDHGVLRYHGAADVVPGEHRVCRLFFNVRAWVVTCASAGAAHPE